MPKNKAHQALPQLEVVEPRPPPTGPPPTRLGVRRAEPPPRRGLADAMHPSEDGQPMASNQKQGRIMVECDYPLREYFIERTDVLVALDVRMYYSEGPPPRDVAPDLFVVFGVPSYMREVYRIAEEGKAPDWVLEVASKSTYKRDVGAKKDLYEALGVGEYFVFDPQGGLHHPRLRGWVLRAGRYEELTDLQRPGVRRALWSATLGLELRFDGSDLRLWNPTTRAYLESITESRQRADKEKARADKEKARAEEEKARAEEEKARAKKAEARADQEKSRADQEKGRADEAEAKLEVEARARRAVEARLAALQSKIGRT